MSARAETPLRRIVPLLGTEQLAGGRLPYLDPCDQAAAGNCDEYPVLTMWTMRLAAWVSGPNIASFFYANAIALWIAAFAITARHPRRTPSSPANGITTALSPVKPITSQGMKRLLPVSMTIRAPTDMA